MRKLWRSGFTLIELLVVISIIAILAAVLTPAVTDALTRGKMTGTMNNGRSIYLSLFAKDTEDPVFQSGSPFPKSTDAYQNSTEYWRYVVTNGIMNVDYSFFSAPGIEPYKGTVAATFLPKNNAWCISQDMSDATPDGAPFLFTRNLVIDRTMPGPFDAQIQAGVNPYGTKGVVMVTKGGSAMTLKKDYLNANFNPPTNDVPVLRPGGVGVP